MSPKDMIRQIVCRWYGMIGMPLRILSCEEEIEEYETNHPEVPPNVWEFVNHKLRQAILWAKNDDVDVIIEDGGVFTLVQDLIFREKFDSMEDWRKECQEEIIHAPKVWIVYHEDRVNPLSS